MSQSIEPKWGERSGLNSPATPFKIVDSSDKWQAILCGVCSVLKIPLAQMEGWASGTDVSKLRFQELQ